MIIRCEIEISLLEQQFKAITGRTPGIWAGNETTIQLLFRRNGVIANADVALYDFLKLSILADSRTGAAFASQTIAAASLDVSLTEETWADGSKQHVEFTLAPSETEFPITDGTNEKKYWLVIGAGTAADGLAPGTLGGADLYVYRDGVPEDPGYIIAGSIIPGGATYDVAGEYVLNVTVDRWYKWVSGPNDDSVTNGLQTVSASNTNFITQVATLTLNGTPSEPVTAMVYPSPVLTADEVQALLDGLGAGADNVILGESAVGSGVDEVTVDLSALALSAAPTSVLPYVIKPGVGALIFCQLVDGSITSTQFKVQLSAQTELATYKIGYQLIVGSSAFETGESAVGAGVSEVVVDISALSLASTPESIQPFIIKPAVGDLLFCALVIGSATATQFTVQLSATTTLSTYKIGYQIKP